MLVLLITVAFGIAIGYFATQNTDPITVRLAEYAFEEVPLYLVVMGTLLAGILIAWVLYFAKSVSASLTIYGKEKAVKKANHTVADLEQRVYELETEIARLRVQRSKTSEFPRAASLK
jgi:uncharacterized integral membrane protein